MSSGQPSQEVAVAGANRSAEQSFQVVNKKPGQAGGKSTFLKRSSLVQAPGLILQAGEEVAQKSTLQAAASLILTAIVGKTIYRQILLLERRDTLDTPK